MVQVRGASVLLVVVICLVAVAACGGSSRSHGAAGAAPSIASATTAATGARSPSHAAAEFPKWTARLHVHGVVDLSVPRPDGAVVVAAHGKLFTLARGSGIRPFAPAYSAPPGLEAYIALSPGQRVADAGCAFPAGSLYALRLAHGVGVTVVSPQGAVRKFVGLPKSGLENGIAFDAVGHFGHRLLVTATVSRKTTVFAIDCRGHVQILTRTAPRVEGGMQIAPPTFGRFAGDLIAPDEISGNLYAFTPSGGATLLARSGLPHGQDVGVESEGFVPARFQDALVSDRGTPGNPHPGDDLILGLSRATLVRAGVAPGDLIVASEGGAATVDVRCASTCRVTHIADGPTIAHIEGHVVFSATF
jgi:hypothetical protein